MNPCWMLSSATAQSSRRPFERVADRIEQLTLGGSYVPLCAAVPFSMPASRTSDLAWRGCRAVTALREAGAVLRRRRVRPLAHRDGYAEVRPRFNLIGFGEKAAAGLARLPSATAV